MGRPSISEQRRIEIGRALQKCMVRNGSYESTSVKDIAQEAGIATGLVHHYFTSKDEILFLMADSAMLSITNLFEDLLHTHEEEDRRERVRELLGDTSQNRFILMLHTLSLSMPEIKTLILSRHHELEENLAARLCRSRTFEGDPEKKAFELMFLLESAVLQSALGEYADLENLLFRVLQDVFPV